ncbi:heme ABC exporter ATP-binding protein CcmA [Aquabacter spiritensis]|uniref:Heme exporter protein A n=1 Tax=Aquabacter spiritensis TaxID=933073 RepID=A0A4R3M238_9HYPH|nr:heme ABC exporter ATP-binding protein CcmA [Aquabacter spiritensis]TCT05257.1 heme exporter protein A [Aquabacter spiritensis]
MCNASIANRDSRGDRLRLNGEALACRRGTRLLFADLSFTVAAGEALVVTGPNGAGKSSLLRIVAGLMPATSGRVRLSGVPAEARISEQVHYLGHEDAVKGALRVGENLAFWRAVLGRTGAEVGDALEAVGLGGLGRLPASALSAGQRRRLAIARLLVADRPVWVLDEPTTALDAAAQARFAALGRDHLAGGGLILAATHAPLDFGPEVRGLRLGAPA